MSPAVLTWYEEMKAKQQEEADQLRSVLKPAVFETLKAHHINTVVINFDGEGDSGQITEIRAYAEAFSQDTPRILPEDLDGFKIPNVQCLDKPLREQVENLAYGFLNTEHGGWENNDGAYGEIWFLIPENKMFLDHNERVMKIENSESEW